MTALIRSELMQLRTLRSTYAAALGLVALIVAITAGSLVDAGTKGLMTPDQLREPVVSGRRLGHLPRTAERAARLRRVSLRDDRAASPRRAAAPPADRGEAGHLRSRGERRRGAGPRVLDRHRAAAGGREGRVARPHRLRLHGAREPRRRGGRAVRAARRRRGIRHAQPTGRGRRGIRDLLRREDRRHGDRRGERLPAVRAPELAARRRRRHVARDRRAGPRRDRRRDGGTEELFVIPVASGNAIAAFQHPFAYA